MFPREQVLVFRYRALIESPAQVLDQICAFLGVPQGVLTELPRENVTAHPDADAAAPGRVQGGAHRIDGQPRCCRARSALTDSLERILQRDARRGSR